MNKSDLIKQIAKDSGFTQVDATKVLDATLNAIMTANKQGEQVTLIGFGTFKVLDRHARIGRHPRTGETLEIPASKLPKFVPGKAYNETINGKKS